MLTSCDAWPRIVLSKVKVIKRIIDREEDYYIVKGVKDTRYHKLPMKVHAERVFTEKETATKEMQLLQRINNACYSAEKLPSRTRYTYKPEESLV